MLFTHDTISPCFVEGGACQSGRKTEGALRGNFSARKPCSKTKAPFLSGSNSFIRCVGCGGQIHDQFILRVAPNLEWHAACLKCCECQMFLDENHTCFVREGKTYCKKDYVR